MSDEREQLQIGEFAELVGLSIPQLRRYDHLQLIPPAGRSDGGYRYYHPGQTGAARAVALLRAVDMPIADVRRVLAGISDVDRRRLFSEHRARLEARLDEVHRLLDAVDAMNKEGADHMNHPTELSSWLHVIPRVPVSDVERSVSYYEEALGLRRAWSTTDGRLTAIASGEIELFLLVPWTEESPLPVHSFYVYIEDPDALCDEYRRARADIVRPVASRSNGMRDFVVADPDGHRFTLGRGEESLRQVASYYGMEPDEIAVNPGWITRR